MSLDSFPPRSTTSHSFRSRFSRRAGWALAVAFCATGAGCEPAAEEPKEESTEQEFVTLPGGGYLVGHVKQPKILINIDGPRLPAPGAARAALRNNVGRAVRAWLDPMRTFSSEITNNVEVTICVQGEPEFGTYACWMDHTYRDKETGRIITEKMAKRRPTTRKVIVDVKPGDREFYSIQSTEIHVGASTSFQTILHEFGHAFGLGDTYAEGGFFCDIHHGNYAPTSTSVMCNANFAALQQDDVSGIQHVYCNAYTQDCARGILTFISDENRPGSDYAAHYVADARACYNMCAKASACRAFTYVPESGGNVCYLKNRIPGNIPGKGMVSGAKS